LQTGRVVPPLDAPPPQLITSLLSAGLTVCRLHWLEEGNTPPPQDAILYYSLSFLPYARPPHSKIPLRSQSINQSILTATSKKQHHDLLLLLLLLFILLFLLLCFLLLQIQNQIQAPGSQRQK
jgi:hypothetical protein